MVNLLDDPRLDAMAADWLRKHRHGVDTSEAYDDLRQLLAEARSLPEVPCPTCPTHAWAASEWGAVIRGGPPREPIGQYSYSTFGPCPDGKYHDTTCPIARKAMAEAKWPCGRLKYPELRPDNLNTKENT
jgi:hypothetical protein